METDLTIRELSALWITDKQQYVKQSTHAAYALILENHILPAFGDNRQLVETEVQDFALSKLHNGLSRKTVKDLLIVLRMIQKYGVKIGRFPFSEWVVRYPTERENRELEVLSIDHQRRIVQYVREHFTFRNLGIYICLHTGLRIGELCGLKWSDINWTNESICINRTVERVYYIEDGVRRTEVVVGVPKTKHSIREIPISKDVMEMIRPWRTKVSDDFFVLSNEAKPTEPRVYRYYYSSFLKKLGIPHQKFHGLRHTFATRCVESRCDYKTVSAILGHANITTTLNLYVHPNLEQKKKCINEMMKGLWRV